MYSEITGSLMTFDCDSTCCEICLPRAICFSRLYQLPMPRAQPTLRLPMALTSSMPPSVGTLVAEGSTAVADGPLAVGVAAELCGVWSLSLSLCPANEGVTMQAASKKAAIVDIRVFMRTSGSPVRDCFGDYIPAWRQQCQVSYIIGRAYSF